MVILFEADNLPESVHGVVFSTRQQELVARLLINFIKESGNEITKTEMSLFATKLDEGAVLVDVDDTPYHKRSIRVSYNKKQFYDRILAPMKVMGMMAYDPQKKVYHLSEHFNKALNRIAVLWSAEVRKPAIEFAKISQ